MFIFVKILAGAIAALLALIILEVYYEPSAQPKLHGQRLRVARPANSAEPKITEAIEKAAFVEDEVRTTVDRFSRRVISGEIHELIERCGGIHVPEGMNRFIAATGNSHPQMQFAHYDSEWMGAFPCYWYAFHIIRREPLEEFFDPHSSFEPLGILAAQGYEPVEPGDAQDNDVVMYFYYVPDYPIEEFIEPGVKYYPPREGKLIKCEHWGVMRDGKVISKNLFSSVARHTLNAGGSTRSRYMIFRKPFDSSLPVPEMEEVADWYTCEFGVLSEATARKAIAPKQRPRLIYSIVFGCAFALGLFAADYFKR